jgi:ABC-2 type transport system permease protein
MMTRTDLAPPEAEVLDPAGSGPETGSLRRDLRTLRLLWQREMLRFARNRLRLAMGLVTPLVFLLILGTGLSSALGDGQESLRDYTTYLFPGVLMMTVQAPSLAVGVAIVWDRQAGVLRLPAGRYLPRRREHRDGVRRHGAPGGRRR